MKLFTPAILSLAASALLATSVSAQSLCGFRDNEVITDVAGKPFDPLVGQWAFHWEATNYSPQGSAAIGTINVTRQLPANGGYLQVDGTMTVNAGDRILRLATMASRRFGPSAQYQCQSYTNTIRGGSLHFPDGSQDTIWLFVFKTDSYDEIAMINEEYIDNIGLAHTLKGQAVKFNSTTQTANCNTLAGNPLRAGTGEWTLSTQSAVFDNERGTSAIGHLNFLNPLARPSVVGTISANHGAPNGTSQIIRLAPTAGSYEPTACNNIALGGQGNGATMSFMVGAYATQYEAIYTNNLLSNMYILSLTNTATGPSLFGDPRFKTDIFNGTLMRFSSNGLPALLN